MKIRIDCEESQTVTLAFLAKGHDVNSCDILPCSGGYPQLHIQGDCLALDRSGIDLFIAFPPCTHLALSGAKHFEKKRADGRQESGIRLFFEIWKYADCCENPMGILNGGDYIRKWFPVLYKEMVSCGFPFKPTQIIQPWQFGDMAQKTTCLWLKKTLKPLYHNGIPNLFDTKITHVSKGEFYLTPSGKKMPKWMCDPIDEHGKKLSYKSVEIKSLRSKTFPGIAAAMADQWG